MNRAADCISDGAAARIIAHPIVYLAAAGARRQAGRGRYGGVRAGRRRCPRDWAGTFDPQLIAKYQRRFPGFDEKIISMYARGMTVREIQGHLREL